MFALGGFLDKNYWPTLLGTRTGLMVTGGATVLWILGATVTFRLVNKAKE